jgi:hypothetical protein
VAGVLACGDVTGFMGPERAAEMGARVGRAAAVLSRERARTQGGE